MHRHIRELHETGDNQVVVESRAYSQRCLQELSVPSRIQRTKLREVKLDIIASSFLHINVLQISKDAFSGCICQMLKLTFGDDMEALLSQLPNNPVY